MKKIKTGYDEIDKLPQVNPLIINANRSTWIHPQIEHELRDEVQDKSTGILAYTGILLRVWLGDNTHVVTLVDEETMNDLLQYDDETEKYTWNHELSEQVAIATLIALTEDTWMPGGEQFCFTEFGKNIDVGDGEWQISPDVCLHHIEDHGWAWSS